MIEVRGLTKNFGDVTAVDDLSFQVPEGDMFALLGRNGAGKSTTISCMTTIMGFDAGTISMNGREVGREDHEIRGDLGVVFQNSVLDPILSVEENLRIRSRIYGVGKSRIDALMDELELSELASRRYGVLSGGERRRVDIARALLHSPRTLFLDEPTTGLDPQSRDRMWTLLGKLRTAEDLTILLTTHYMEETETADQVVILDHGRTVAAGTPIALRAQHSLPRLSLAVDPETVPLMMRSISERLEGTGFPAEPEAEGGAWHLRVPDSATAMAILYDLNGRTLDFEFRHGSMQDVFLTVTGEEE